MSDFKDMGILDMCKTLGEMGEEPKAMRDRLTKREYFSALAMMGICASGRAVDIKENIGIVSIRCADNLIAELNK